MQATSGFEEQSGITGVGLECAALGAALTSDNEELLPLEKLRSLTDQLKKDVPGLHDALSMHLRHQAKFSSGDVWATKLAHDLMLGLFVVKSVMEDPYEGHATSRNIAINRWKIEGLMPREGSVDHLSYYATAYTNENPYTYQNMLIVFTEEQDRRNELNGAHEGGFARGLVEFSQREAFVQGIGFTAYILYPAVIDKDTVTALT